MNISNDIGIHGDQGRQSEDELGTLVGLLATRLMSKEFLSGKANNNGIVAKPILPRKFVHVHLTDYGLTSYRNTDV